MENDKKPSLGKRLSTLFFSNLIISACTFGGGAVIIPIFQKKYVDELKWINEDEMMDMISIAQSAPGIMAVNAAIMIGYRIAGVLGALISTLGAVLPPMFILGIISFIYDAFVTNKIVALLLKGMQAGVAAVVLNVTISMMIPVLKRQNILYDILMFVGLALTIFFGLSTIWLIAACAVVSLIYTIIITRKTKKEANK